MHFKRENKERKLRKFKDCWIMNQRDWIHVEETESISPWLVRGEKKGIESLPQILIFYSLYPCNQIFFKLWILLD